MNSFICTDEEFIRIYNKYVNMIYQICFLYLKNKEDTEDAVQHTFIKLLENKKEFNNEEHIKAWLIRTSSNICKNQLKYWWNKNKDVIDLNNIEKDEKNDETLEVLLKLPQKYKIIIYMYYYMGYSTEDIANIMKQKNTTIRSLLCRGRERLKKMLGGEYD